MGDFCCVFGKYFGVGPYLKPDRVQRGNSFEQTFTLLYLQNVDKGALQTIDILSSRHV